MSGSGSGLARVLLIAVALVVAIAVLGFRFVFRPAAHAVAAVHSADPVPTLHRDHGYMTVPDERGDVQISADADSPHFLEADAGQIIGQG